MRVELSRYRVKPGKSARVDDWLAMLNANMSEIKQTLVREEMKVEVIFRNKLSDIDEEALRQMVRQSVEHMRRTNS